MIRRAMLLAIFLGAISVGALSADEPFALYRETVTQTRVLVERARAETLPARREELLRQAAAFLNTVEDETLPHNATLITEIYSATQNPQDTTRIENVIARLRALETALAHPPTAASASDRAILRDILNRPPFAQAIENPFEQFLNQIAEWLDRLLSGIARGIFESRDAVVILGLIVMIAAVAYFLRNLLINLTPEAALPTVAPDDLPRTSRAARAHAQEFANQGDYRAATRQLYLATLLLLDERDLLRYDRALTNREYLRAVQRTPRLADALAPVIATFDRTWYGFEKMDRAEYVAYQHQVEMVREIE
ncbi:MAG: DUF4129 domain-containing protein [Chloroflexi bacterium]|nr:DUF4129 domain-containing protein [Chloroflexota bacterium]